MELALFGSYWESWSDAFNSVLGDPQAVHLFTLLLSSASPLGVEISLDFEKLSQNVDMQYKVQFEVQRKVVWSLKHTNIEHNKALQGR